MFMKVQMTIALLTSTWPQFEQPPKVCEPYIGTVVSTTDIDDAMAPFRKIAPKGEFETTDQFNARQKAAIDKFASVMIFRKVPENRQSLVYNADTQILSISKDAIENKYINISHILFPIKENIIEEINARRYNLETVVEEDDVLVGSYQASNAFGAKTEIWKILRKTRILYEYNSTKVSDKSIFPKSENDLSFISSIPMTPNEAMRLKPLIKFGFVAIPKPPYFMSATGYQTAPTFSNRKEVINEVSAIVADIKCVLVLDQVNKVLDAIETR